MNQVFYLEPDEEITAVINRIRKSEKDGVVFVIPRGAAITQSAINLKLLKRSADELEKSIGIVSSDKVTKNLANQVKIKVFDRVNEAEKAELVEPKPIEEAKVDSEDLGFKVHTYKKYDLSKISQKDEDKDIDHDNTDLDEMVKEEAPEIDLKEEKVSDLGGESLEQPKDDLDASKDAYDQQEDDEAETIASEPREESVKTVEEKEEEVAPVSNYRPEKRYIRTQGTRKVFAILAGIIIVAILAVSYVYIPTVSASLILKTTDVNKELGITVDKSATAIDSDKLVIPGQIVDIETTVTKTFDSTGKKDAGAKATGTVTISNTASTKSIPVSPGTRVVASDGKVFTVQTGVMVPGMTIKNTQVVDGKITYDIDKPGTIDATVVATENGDSYNLAPTKFTVGTLSAESKSAFTGGITKNISYVTDDDLAKAQLSIKDDALTQGKADLADKAGKADLKIVEKFLSTEVLTLDSDKKANDEADKFQINSKVKVLAIGFSESDIRKISVAIATNGLQKDEMLVNPEKAEVKYEVAQSNIDDGTLKIQATFAGKAGKNIVAETIKKEIVNKSTQDAKSILSNIDGVESASLKPWPSFFTRTPILQSKIKVNFDYQK